MEERLKPPLMRFMEKLNHLSGVDKWLAQDTVREVEDPGSIVTVMKDKAKTMAQMSRGELIGFLQTVLHLRDSFLEENIQAGVDVMQELASNVLRVLGRPTITWVELPVWEAKVLRQVIREVEDVPLFLVRLADQILSEVAEKNSEDQQMETNDVSE